MNIIFVMLISCALVYFFPQYRIQSINSFFSLLFDFLFNKITARFLAILILLVVFFLSFVLPTLLLLYTSSISIVLTFIIEIFISYHIISIPPFNDFLNSNSTNDSENASTIVQSIIYFIDFFFIPCLCILLFGIPMALVYRVCSVFAKKAIFTNAQTTSLFFSVNNILLFLPSYILVLSLFTLALFFPFCNTKNAFLVFKFDRKKIEPHWLSRILSACFGLLCIEIPISYTKNGTMITEDIGNTTGKITSQTVRELVYLLYAASILVLSLMIVCRILVTWGVW